jgi:isoleucyl-tRNA synthetase
MPRKELIMAFKPVDTRVSFPALEAEVSAWWREHDVVRRSLESGDRNRPFVFFEGPPTANGKPGVHHVEARVTKDIINRFQRMRGRHVIGARGGWDTHGLPVEVEVEKELGFKGKPDIEKYGIEAFNARCKESVNRYVDEFERLTERIGYWLDLDDPYVTYDNKYIESLWWITKQLSDRDLLFRDYKTTWHCPRCGTTLADAEVALGYEDDTDDPSVWLKFVVSPTDHPLASKLGGASLLAWTTTPWTLPANVALAVKPDAEYTLAEKDGERYVLAQALVERVLGEDALVLDTVDGHLLVDLRYQNLFDGVPGAGDAINPANAYRVIADDFVSLDDGTGIVHIAPAYGDLEIGRKYGLPTLFSVDLNGNVLAEFNELGFGGMFFKEADPLITRNLRDRGLLFRSGRVKHTYPFCWRCKTPLLNFAKRSWYIRTTAVKDRLVQHNQSIHWVPDHIRNGRFGNWLENNIDWALSRERYWGTPLPIWVSENGQHIEVVGSLAELEDKVGRSLQDLDLHRPYVDDLTWEHDEHGVMRRVPDVADAWFDSGAMPVAQWHYPFENQELFQVAQQADYISEAIDQTRGWFYTLHALAVLLFDRPAFKNVICLGHILDVRGEKMSKSKGNVVDPFLLVEQYGADATRWYMFASAPPYNPRRFAPEHVGEMLRQFMLTLWNTYSFFVTYANLDGWQPTAAGDGYQVTGDGNNFPTPDTRHLTPIDRWLLASLNKLVKEVTADLEDYDIYQPTKRIEAFVEELSNWYVRRNRRRFWKSESDADKQAAYATLYTALVTLSRLLAPFTPFVAESMYQNLVGLETRGEGLEGNGDFPASSPQLPAPASVHLAPWPEADEALIDEALIAQTETLLRAVTAGRAARKGSGVKVRQPLQTLLLRAPTAAQTEGLRRFEDELRDELNVKEVKYLEGGAGLVEYRFKPNLKLVGKKYGKQVPALKAALEALSGSAAAEAGQRAEAGQTVTVEVDGQPLELLAEELLVETSSPEGYAVSEDGGVLVALDTTLTDELRLEGAARDLVRVVQDARKEAGFEIADRIRLHLSGLGAHHEGVSLDQLVERHGAYVRGETLAEELLVGAIPSSAFQVNSEVGGVPMEVGVERV